MKNKNSVAIIGAGPLGRALEKILNEAGVKLLIWDIDQSKMMESRTLPETVKSAEIIFLCVPSSSLRKAAEEVSLYSPKDAIIVSLSKGLETDSKKTMSELLHLCVGLRNCAIVSGPMLASEIMKGEQSFGILATSNKPAFKKIARLFANSSLHLSYSRDLTGVALAGVLKNVYAIAFGMVRGLGMGDNVRGWLVTSAVSEMSNIIELLGGNKKTAYTIAGIGDLIATGMSPNSRNHSFGFEIATKSGSDIISEGLVSLPPLRELIQDKKGNFLIFEAVYQIVINHKDPKSALIEVIKVLK